MKQQQPGSSAGSRGRRRQCASLLLALLACLHRDHAAAEHVAYGPQGVSVGSGEGTAVVVCASAHCCTAPWAACQRATQPSTAGARNQQRQADWRGEIVQLSWRPRAYHLKGLLSDEECEHIKRIVSARAWIQRGWTRAAGRASALL
jgi:hypothetical protein